jgi:hypothetical protein
MKGRLDRALRALRQEQDGSSAAAEETLARVLDGLRLARARRSKRLRTALLAAAVLVISTAAAAATGRLGPLVHAFRSRGQGEVEDKRVAPPPAAARLAQSAQEQPAAAPRGPTAQVADPVVADPSPPRPPPAALPVPSARPHAQATPTGSAAAPGSAATAASASSEEPARPGRAPSRDEEMYVHAHRLHFDGANPAAALSAWDDYLRSLPDGRFVPEARFNRAIDLVKLQRYPEARQSLVPFANGAYGAYHRDEAVALLRSIPTL